MSSSYDPASAPEVAFHHAPQVYPDHDPPEVVREDHDVYPEKTRNIPYEFDPTTRERRLFGLRLRTFWIMIVVIVVVLAAIGGGVAGGLSANKESHTMGTTTASPSSAPGGATTTSSMPSSTQLTSCNASDHSFFTPQNAALSGRPYTINDTTLTYRIFCYTNYADASSGLNHQIYKLAQTVGLASLEDCITACATYNSAIANINSRPSFAKLCSGIVYIATDTPTTCDMNSNVFTNATSVEFGPNQQIDSAVLDWKQ